MAAARRPFYLYPRSTFDLQRSVDHFMANHDNIHPSVHADNFDVAEHSGPVLLYQGLKAHPARVDRPEQAELFVFPTPIPYGNISHHYAQMAEGLRSSPWFQRSGGRDHIIFAGHWICGRYDRHLYPLLANATVLSVDNKWCCGGHPDATVTAPYVPHADLLRARLAADGPGQPKEPLSKRRPSDRPLTVFFQGNLHRRYKETGTSRRSLFKMFFNRYAKLLGGRERVLIVDSGALLQRGVEQSSAAEMRRRHVLVTDYAVNMHRARFCLVLHGDSSTSRRLFDALAAGCIPLVIEDHLVFQGNLPLYPWLPWSDMAVFMPELGFLSDPECAIKALMGISPSRLERIRNAGQTAWRELSFCAADDETARCATPGRAAANLLAVAGMAQANRTAYALLTRPVSPSDFGFVRLDHCKEPNSGLRHVMERHLVRGASLEEHTCERLDVTDSSGGIILEAWPAGYMSTRR
eukprot:UC1_evm1s691